MGKLWLLLQDFKNVNKREIFCQVLVPQGGIVLSKDKTVQREQSNHNRAPTAWNPSACSPYVFCCCCVLLWLVIFYLHTFLGSLSAVCIVGKRAHREWWVPPRQPESFPGPSGVCGSCPMGNRPWISWSSGRYPPQTWTPCLPPKSAETFWWDSEGFWWEGKTKGNNSKITHKLCLKKI